MESEDISEEPHTLATSDKPAAGPTPSASIYHPLPAGNFFRFLRLEPGNGTDPLRCKLEVVAIDDVVDEYEAISYVWGDPTVTEVITCNDFPISVTTNLADALRSFRFADIERFMWADAICINQQDIEERGSQVQMMDQVYANAKHVLSWLGHDSGDEAKACFHLIAETNKLLGKAIQEELAEFPESHAICTERKRWIPVDRCLNLPYFRRVWVVQEVALAKECALWWGTEHMNVAQLFEFVCWCSIARSLQSLLDDLRFEWHRPLSLLHLLFMMVYRHSKLKASWPSSLSAIKILSETTQQERSAQLVCMFWIASLMEASDPRDRIYALLGTPLAKTPDGETLIKPNYNLSVEDVYFDTACALLQNKREAPLLLSHAGCTDRKDHPDDTSPSWVPAWHLKVDSDRAQHWTAGGTVREFQVVVNPDSKALIVTGSICDKIVWLSSEIVSDDLMLHWFSSKEARASGKPLIDTLWEQVSAFNTVTEDDFALTMVAGQIRTDLYSKHPNQLSIYLEHFALYRQHFRAKIAKPEDKAVRRRLREIGWNLRNCDSRRLAVTEGGRLALVSSSTPRIGDLCCVILGLSMPFILTPAGEKGHRLVCTSYTRGLMDGEIAQEFERGLREKEIITII